MKICDLTQFYSPFSGGVKRYLHEKIAYIRNHSPEDEHVLVVPGSKTEVATDARSRKYSTLPKFGIAAYIETARPTEEGRFASRSKRGPGCGGRGSVVRERCG